MGHVNEVMKSRLKTKLLRYLLILTCHCPPTPFANVIPFNISKHACVLVQYIPQDIDNVKEMFTLLNNQEKRPANSIMKYFIAHFQSMCTYNIYDARTVERTIKLAIVLGYTVV